jgi:hypothetical protein
MRQIMTTMGQWNGPNAAAVRSTDRSKQTIFGSVWSLSRHCTFRRHSLYLWKKETCSKYRGSGSNCEISLKISDGIFMKFHEIFDRIFFMKKVSWNFIKNFMTSRNDFRHGWDTYLWKMESYRGSGCNVVNTCIVLTWCAHFSE